MSRKREVDAGRFYRVGEDVTEVAPREKVTWWVCRRVADYDTPTPTGAAHDDCGLCGERIVYNPASTVRGSRICMQCAGITPLPMGRGDA